ncbi:MAG: alkaline phosphatase family protein [Beijerinckiaceae bacterium]|nr:alkaline phosphatase family protein [Beijerinckiaceae bacterium]
MRRFSLFMTALAVSGIATAQDAPSAPPATIPSPPKLIVAISVDQFSGDLFAEYRQYYVAGLKRLTQGAVFPRGYQSHAATETCPGHSTILTGSRPSRTGIIANSWFDPKAPRPDKMVYCVEDENQPGTDSQNYVVSPVHMRVPTLGGRMKLANPATRVVSVAGKDRAAVMMGGASADQTWWLTPKGYTSYRGVAATARVERLNRDMLAQLGAVHDKLPIPAACTAKGIPIDVGRGKLVGTGQFAREAGDFAAFRASPEQDTYTLRLAFGLIDDLKLGRGPATDIISIGLSANDYVGHTFGTAGTEMCIQQFALDQALGQFFRKLDRTGVDYVVMLTADHGGHDLPERHRMNAMPMEQRVDPALLPQSLSDAIGLKTGIKGNIILGEGAAGDLYFAPELSPSSRNKAKAEALAILQPHPQVQAVFARDQIMRAPLPSGPPESWSLLEEVRASFDPARSGDLFVVLKPRVTSIADPTKGYVATHGSPWDTDRRVPILFWRRDMARFEQPLGVETVDILPTLGSLIGLTVPPQEIDGRCLDLIPGPLNSCAR